MKKLLLVALLAVWLPGCGPDQNTAYHLEKDIAEQKPAYQKSIGLHLRFGMLRPQVVARIDSLREIDELGFQLRFGRVPIRPEPEYLNGRLVRLGMMLEGDGLPGDLQHEELIRLLNAEYGENNYPHGIKALAAKSWFVGAAEVELTCIPARGYFIQYTDLKNEMELVQTHFKTDSIRQVGERDKI